MEKMQTTCNNNSSDEIKLMTYIPPKELEEEAKDSNIYSLLDSVRGMESYVSRLEKIIFKLIPDGGLWQALSGNDNARPSQSFTIHETEIVVDCYYAHTLIPPTKTTNVMP